MYTIWKIKKRNGGFRVIESPCDSLKQQQNESLKELKREWRVSPFAHAFQPYRNIVTMAMPHVKKKWVLSVDLEDFFPSINISNFMNIINEKYPIPLMPRIHFHDFKDGKGERLPQGAPGSPFISNIYMHDFDWRMAWRCYSHGCDYTRYADDITISGDNKKDLISIYAYMRGVLKETYSLNINKKKTKYMPHWKRQLVCGVIVNEKLNLPRRWRKNLRAELFQQQGGDLSNKTEGKLSFRHMVLNNQKKSFSSTEIIRAQVILKRIKPKK